jgi:hypothetical protein
LRALFPVEGWEVAYVNYTNVVVYPVVWLVRKWRALRAVFGAKITAGTRSEDRIPAAWLNSLLGKIFAGMAEWRVPFPFGVSLVLVARRR